MRVGLFLAFAPSVRGAEECVNGATTASSPSSHQRVEVGGDAKQPLPFTLRYEVGRFNLCMCLIFGIFYMWHMIALCFRGRQEVKREARP